METYNAKQVGAMLGIQPKTVSVRAESLGIRKRHKNWVFSFEQVERIKAYLPKRFINTKFSFSDDGEYLIINSKLNKCEI